MHANNLISPVFSYLFRLLECLVTKNIALSDWKGSELLYRTFKTFTFLLQVRWTVYLQYIRAIGLAVFGFNFFMYFVTEGLSASANYVLSR